jgi:D-lactate dehydrogenase (cytochrome)
VDITVPRSRLTEMLVEVDAICEQQDVRTGHVMHAGDGNLHPMLLIPEPDNPDLMRRILTAGREIVQCCVDKGGSLTGEHGVGIEKREYMSLMHKPIELLAMWDVKQAFDPHNLLNPGKVFPPPEKGEDGPFAGYSARGNGSAASRLAPRGATFVPASLEEAAEGLRALTQEDRCVTISNAQRSVGDAVRMSAEALRGVKTYAPDDMYIIVGAGTPLREVQEFLAQDGRQLALASPWPEATIGGLIAANVNAPLRMRYGAMRDLVLYTQVALADGRVIRTGRPIVKNVAGYDLSKALIGSYGTLGFIGEVALKVVVKPRTRRTLFVPVDDLRHGLIWARQVLPLALVASGIVLCKGYRGAHIPLESAYALAYTAEGLTEDVQAELEQVRQVLQVMGCPDPIEVDDLGATDIWSELLNSTSGSLQVRVGVPARELPTYIQDQSATLDAGSFLADLSSGFVYSMQQPGTLEEAQQTLKALRAPALRLEGYAVVMDAPEKMADRLDRWGYTPQGIDVMKALKQRWDPRGILVSPEGFLRA